MLLLRIIAIIYFLLLLCIIVIILSFFNYNAIVSFCSCFALLLLFMIIVFVFDAGVDAALDSGSAARGVLEIRNSNYWNYS